MSLPSPPITCQPKAGVLNGSESVEVKFEMKPDAPIDVINGYQIQIKAIIISPEEYRNLGDQKSVVTHFTQVYL